jgi:NDP-sugar pyrophosphorylase family protein
MLAAGVDRVVVNLHHLADPLEAYLREQYGSRCSFFFSREEEILGTGGGIRRVREQLDGAEPFLLANGDTVQVPPFRALVDACSRSEALAALLLRRPPENDRFTKVFFDGRRVTGFGSGAGEALMFAGAHAISPAIFDLLPDRDFSGLTEDVYAPAAERGTPPLAGVLYDGPWFDIGTPARYMEATAAVLRMMREGGLPLPAGSEMAEDSLAATGGRIEGNLASCVIADGAVVETRADAARSVLWEGAVVRGGARVSDAIIGRGVTIPAGSSVRGALVCRRLAGVNYSEGTNLAGDLAWVPIRPGEDHVELRG